MKLADFYTREHGNAGHKLALPSPSGTPSEHWLRVASVDSDIFRDSELRYRREVAALAQRNPTPEEQQAHLKAMRIELLSRLVLSWSFEEPCDTTNVSNLLREAPYIADLVDVASANRRLFLPAPASNSLSSLGGS